MCRHFSGGEWANASQCTIFPWVNRKSIVQIRCFFYVMLVIVRAIVSTNVAEGNAAAKEQVSQTTFTTRPLRIQRVQTRIFLT